MGKPYISCTLSTIVSGVARPRRPGLLEPVPYHQLSRPYHQQLSKTHMILKGIKQESKYITHLDISVCMQCLSINFMTYEIQTPLCSDEIY